jgi:hypothetical protein
MWMKMLLADFVRMLKPYHKLSVIDAKVVQSKAAMQQFFHVA